MPWTLLTALFLLGAIAWLVNSFAPDSSLLLALFFVLVGSDIALFVSFFFKNARIGILVGAGVVAFLLLRMLELRSPLYLALLVIVLASLELTWKKR